MVSKFGAVQMVVQAIMAVCGFIIVRTLTKESYALFIIANTLQSAMSQLADAGISVGVTAIGGGVWADRRRLGALVNTARNIRRWMALVSITCITPLLVWLLVHHGATLPQAALLTAATLGGLAFQLDVSVFRMVPQLCARFSRLQRLDFWSAVLRLTLIAALAAIFFNATVAVLTMSVVFACQWVVLRRWAWEDAERRASPDAADRAEIYRKIRQVLPDTLFYCLQGQLWIFLISLTGKSTQVAEVGALGRFAVILSVLTSVMSSVVAPAFSRCRSAAVLRRRYLQVVGGFILFGGFLVASAWCFPQAFLWILGARYANLRYELVLMMASTALTGVYSALWTLNAAKGWTQYLWVDIPIRLSLQAALLFVFDVSTVTGVIFFTIITSLSPIMVCAALAWRGLRTAREEEARAALSDKFWSPS